MARRSEDPEDLLQVKAMIRARLEKYQRERQLTKLELARRLGMSDSNLGRMLNANRGVGLYLLMRMRQRLHVSMDDIVDEALALRPSSDGQRSGRGNSDSE